MLTQEEFCNNVTSNMHLLKDRILPKELVDRLVARKVLTPEQAREIKANATNYDKNGPMLDILITRPEEEIPIILECFQDSNQPHIANIISVKGTNCGLSPGEANQDEGISCSLPRRSSLQPCENQMSTSPATSGLIAGARKIGRQLIGAVQVHQCVPPMFAVGISFTMNGVIAALSLYGIFKNKSMHQCVPSMFAVGISFTTNSVIAALSLYGIFKNKSSDSSGLRRNLDAMINNGDSSGLRRNLDAMINNGYFVDHIVVFGGTAAGNSRIDALAIAALRGDLGTPSLQRDVMIVRLSAGYNSGEYKSLSACLHEGSIYVFQCWDDYPLLLQHQCDYGAWIVSEDWPKYQLCDDFIFSWCGDLYVYCVDKVYGAMVLFRMDVSGRRWKGLSLKNGVNREFAAITSENSLYVIGGCVDDICCAHVEKFVINEDKWVSMKSMLQPRQGHASVKLDDYIYACGGKDNDGKVLSSCEKYSIRNDEWTEIAPMKVKRCEFSVVAANGILLAVGGTNRESSNISSIEIYNPEDDNWTQACDGLQAGSFGHATVVLPAEYVTDVFKDIIAGTFEKLTKKKERPCRVIMPV